MSNWSNNVRAWLIIIVVQLFVIIFVLIKANAYEVEVTEHCTKEYTASKDGMTQETVCTSYPSGWKESK